MKINPDSPDFERQVDSTKTPSQTGKVFSETLASGAQQPNAAAGAPPLAARGLTTRDLADPVKADTAIDRAVQELMENEFGGMCAPDREHVAAWLRSDPLIRSALLQRLTS